MSSNKKTLANQLSGLLLPKLKGLTEKNAKKLLETVDRSAGEIAKKYIKFIQEQDNEAAKVKEKAEKVKKKLAEKEAKKKAKLAKKAAELKQVAQLMSKESAPSATKVAAKSPAKPQAKVIKK